ncbi:MAG: MaoC/PaaZ C-terminal domain-containing protein [Thermoguttaceae bacterium]
MFKEYFEDCELGEKIVTPGRTITEADVVMFAALSGDWNAVHTDKEYAEKHTPYGQRIAHGLLGLVAGICLLSRVGWFLFWPKSMVCITGIDKVRFVLPILIGDTIHLDAEIIEKKKTPDGMGLLTTRLRIRNQRDEAVITGRIKLMAGCRPQQPQSDTEKEV